jgi:NADH:ubiquinone oxidoreductase subunit 4 (subunit M)
MLRAYRKTFMGSIREQWQKLPDLSPALRVPVTLLVAALLCYGFYPQIFVRSVAPTFGTSLSTNSGTHSCSHGAVRRLETVGLGENAQQGRGYRIR